MLVTTFSTHKSKRRTTAWLNLRTLPSMQFFTYKVMSENSGWPTRFHVFAWKCSHRSTCLHTTCHKISYVVLDRHVSTQCFYYETYSCACSHTKRRLSVHFLTYEVMPMRNFKHITLVCHIISHMCSQTKYITTFFNLRTLLTMQLLTYKDVSVRKLSHRRTCLCATYHIISYALSRPPCFHAVCWLPDEFMCMFAHYKTGVCTLFWLMKSCLCVNLNISHLVCHIIFHKCTRNKVPHHAFLTYEPFSLCNFWLTRISPCANCHIWGRVCLQRVTKFLTFYLNHHVSTHCVD